MGDVYDGICQGFLCFMFFPFVFRVWFAISLCVFVFRLWHRRLCTFDLFVEIPCQTYLHIYIYLTVYILCIDIYIPTGIYICAIDILADSLDI